MYGFRSGLGIAQPPDCAQPFCLKGITDCSTWGGWMSAPSCWSQSPSSWATMAQAVAPPPAPTGPVLTVPPANQAQADATVTALVNQQMADQQAKDAALVDSSAFDLAAGGLYQGGAAVGTFATGLASIPWYVWAGGAGLVGVLLLRGGR